MKVMFQARIEKPIRKDDRHLVLTLYPPTPEIKKQLNQFFLKNKLAIVSVMEK